MDTTLSDPVIDEVRAARHQISARVGHDSARLVAYYMEFQKRYQGRLIRTSTADEPVSETGPTLIEAGSAAEPGRSPK